MKLNFRQAKITEAKLVLTMIKDLLIELGDEIESLSCLTEQLILNFLKSRNNFIYLIRNESDIIGLFTLTQTNAIYAYGKYGIIDEFYIIPSERQKNVGQTAINYIKKLGLKKGWSRIVVTAPSGSEWTRTIKFYEQNGFVFTGPKLKFVYND